MNQPLDQPLRPRIVQKISRRLRALMKGAGDWGAAAEPDISTLGLIERVRDEWQKRDHAAADDRFDLPRLLASLAERRRANAGRPRPPTVAQIVVEPPPDRLDRQGRRQPLDAEFFARQRYFLDELTGFPEEAFVDVAYRCILKRNADPSGTDIYLTALREGRLDRVAVVEALRTSFEGVARNVAIDGLRSLLRWRRAERIPHVGPLVGWLHAIVDARWLAQRVRRLDAGALSQASLFAPVRRDLHAVAASIATLEESRHETETALLAMANRFRRLQVETGLQTEALESRGRELERRGESAEDAARRDAARIDRLEESLRIERARVDDLIDALADPARVRRTDPLNPTEPT